MNKLKLKLEDLRVDTFATVAPHKLKGTVFGEQDTSYTVCTCPGYPSCDATCYVSCYAYNSCQGGTGCASCTRCPNEN